MKEVSNMSEEVEKAVLEARLHEKEEQITLLKGQIEDLKKQLELEQNGNRNLIKDLYERNNKVLNLFIKNVKAAAFSHRIKSTNLPSPALIDGLNTQDIIADYQANGNSIPKSMVEKYNKAYGISYSGLRMRLVKAGAWNGR